MNIFKRKEKVTNLYKRMESLYNKFYGPNSSLYISKKFRVDLHNENFVRVFNSNEGTLLFGLTYYSMPSNYCLSVYKLNPDESTNMLFYLDVKKDNTKVSPPFYESNFTAEDISLLLHELEQYFESCQIEKKLKYEKLQIEELENY